MTGSRPGMRLTSLLLVAAFMAASCTSYKVVELPRIENRVEAGDTVRVVTTDGRELTFKVTAVTADAIMGDNQRILFSEIHTLEKQEVSPAKTVGLIGGIVAAIIGILFIYAAATCCDHGFSFSM